MAVTYGCHNRPPLKDRLIAQLGWWMDGVSRTPQMTSVPVPLTRHCQYTIGMPNDPKCLGCKHKDNHAD